MRKEEVLVRFSSGGYNCETCDDYVTYAHSYLEVYSDPDVLLSEHVNGDDHYGQMHWFAFYNPLLTFFNIQFVSRDTVVEDNQIVLREKGEEFDYMECDGTVDLEINHVVITTVSMQSVDELHDAMKEIFSHIVSKYTFEYEKCEVEDEDDHWRDSQYYDPWSDQDDDDDCNCGCNDQK